MPESQREFYEDFGGIAFMYPIDQVVLILDTKKTGKVLGPANDGTLDGYLPNADQYYIVQLDQPTSDTKAILVHEDNLRLLTCHWCQDAQQVAVTPFTIGQFETGIPTMPCKECNREEYLKWVTKV